MSNLPAVAQERGIDEATWSALTNTIYPGAKPESVLMAVDYCRSRELDPILKPVHIVPMNVKDAQTGQSAWRDIIMPGIGMYRIQADRSGNYAGAAEPEFGEDVTRVFKDKNGNDIEVTFPKWCKYTVYKRVQKDIVAFVAKEFWLENYATAGYCDAPNAMWKKRPYAQLSKCAEAQALRKAWPEVGNEPTLEEMEGKTIERDVTPAESKPQQTETLKSLTSGQAKQEPQNMTATEAVKREQEYMPNEKAASLAEYIFNAQTNKELHEAGIKINEALEAGEIDDEDRKWLSKNYKAQQQQVKQ